MRVNPWAAVTLPVMLVAVGVGAEPAIAKHQPPTRPGVETIAALPPHLTAGRGATVPFVEQEAENAATNGDTIGPDRRAYTLPSEASGRKAVRLDAGGEYVQFTLTRPANAITFRYAIPDAPTGGGITGPLDVYVDGIRRHQVTLTSEFSWLYSVYPFSNDPNAEPPPDWWIPEPRPVTKPFRPHHFYTEQRLLLGKDLAQGDTVRLQLPANSGLPWVVIDVADFEQVAKPKLKPWHALSVLDFGADPTGTHESSAAFDAAIAAAKARGRAVFIPAGRYQVNRHIIVDDVTVTGAGNWHSIVTGDGVGFYGKWIEDGGSANVHLADFAIIGNVRDRQDDLQVNGIGGAMGGGSIVERMYIQRTKVGMWFDGPFGGQAPSRGAATDLDPTADPAVARRDGAAQNDSQAPSRGAAADLDPTADPAVARRDGAVQNDSLTVRDNVIVDQIADALNLRRGISNVRVTNNFMRNLGDDALAMWSHKVSADETADMDHNNVYDHNTIIAPVLANGIAIYGGRDNTVSDNLVADTVREGGGLHAGYRHGSTRFAGTLTFTRNTTVRAGVLDMNWNFGVGAIWFYSLDGVMDTRIEVTDSSFLDSTYSAIMAVKGYPTANSVSNLRFNNLCIDGAGTYALQLQVAGSGTFSNVDARNLGVAGTWRGDPFDIADAGGNSGWQNDIHWNWPMDEPRPVPPPTNCS